MSKNIAFSFSFSSFRVFAILDRSAICFSSVDMYSLFFFLLLLAASLFLIMRKAFLSTLELTLELIDFYQQLMRITVFQPSWHQDEH